MILVILGIVPNTQAAYPSGILQMLFGVPTTIACWYLVKRTPTLRVVAAASGLLLLVLLFFSRFLIDNYIGSVFTYLLLGYFL